MSGIIEVIVATLAVIVATCLAAGIIFVTAAFVAGWVTRRLDRDD